MESKFNKNSVAILIPMYNEEAVAADCIEAVVPVIRRISVRSQIIVVNDGSRDNTQKILEQKLKKYKKYIHVVVHAKNKGYGGATQTAVREALKQEFVWGLHMDSDLTNDPKYIKDFVASISCNIDCIKASRYIKGSKVMSVPKYRRIISYIGNLVAAVLFHIGINDCTNGFRMVRLKFLQDVEFKENNFSIILEELYELKKKGAKFAEIPYTLTARKNSVSHFSYKPKIFYDYLKYVVKAIIV